MIRKVVIVLLFLAFATSAIYGFIARENSPNLTNWKDYVQSEDLMLNYVYGLGEGDEYLNVQKSILFNSDLVLKITTDGNIRKIFEGMIFDANVIDIIKGPEYLLDQKITIVSNRMKADLSDNSIGGVFVNYPQIDTTYLIFLDIVPELANKGGILYKLPEDSTIPYFIIDETHNTAIPDIGENYRNVKNNEFFSTSEGLVNLEEFKREIISKFVER